MDEVIYMISVQAYYREWWTFRIWRRKFSAEIPDNWDQVNPKFCLAYAKWLVDGQKDAFFGFLRDMLPFAKRVVNSINRDQGNDFIKPLADMLKRPKTGRVMLPVIAIGNRLQWHGPKDYLYNITVAEFYMLYHAKSNYNIAKDKKYLNEMVAIIYRQVGADGLREKFNSELVDFRVSCVAQSSLSLTTKKTVLLNFIALMNWFEDHKDLKVLFEKEEESILNQGIKTQSVNWPKIIFSMSGPRLGTVGDVEALPTLYFLKRLAEEIKSSKKNKKNKVTYYE